MNLSNAAIQNYRQWIRCIKKFPMTDLQPKLMFNVREMFEVHRYEKDTMKIQEMLEVSRKDAVLMKEMFSLPIDVLIELYQPFSTTLIKSNIEEQKLNKSISQN